MGGKVLFVKYSCFKFAGESGLRLWREMVVGRLDTKERQPENVWEQLFQLLFGLHSLAVCMAQMGINICYYQYKSLWKSLINSAAVRDEETNAAELL